jgi:hypothetical protein
MRKLLAFAAVILFMMAGCSEDTTKPKVTPSPYSGRFYVTYTTIETNCPINIPPNSASDITVKESTIVFGSMSGTWIENDKRGYGGGYIGNDCPNHNPPDHCATCITMAFDITFASADSFSGRYASCFTYADCSDDSCHTIYTANGRRM